MTSLLQSKRVVEMISRVVRMASTEVALGDVWLQIHQAYGVGRISGRRLLLDAEDRKALRSLAERHTGWDPHVAGSKIQGGRAELAASMRNEKNCPVSVSLRTSSWSQPLREDTAGGLCPAADAWMHVDGAFKAGCRAAPDYHR